MVLFSQRQLNLIESLKSYGYGWEKFANSVYKSGRCSIKQEITMENMLSKVNAQSCYVFYIKNNKQSRNRCSNSIGGTGCSDGEAMLSGDYF